VHRLHRGDVVHRPCWRHIRQANHGQLSAIINRSIRIARIFIGSPVLTTGNGPEAGNVCHGQRQAARRSSRECSGRSRPSARQEPDSPASRSRNGKARLACIDRRYQTEDTVRVPRHRRGEVVETTIRSSSRWRPREPLNKAQPANRRKEPILHALRNHGSGGRIRDRC